MTIKTKFDIGQKVFFLHNNMILQREVISIDIQVRSVNAAITYKVIEEKDSKVKAGSLGFEDADINLDEDEIFETTKELHQYLDNNINATS